MTHHSLSRLPSAILFDWDDTLIQTWPFLWQLYKRTFHHVGKDIVDFFDEAACKDYAVRHGRKTFDQIFGNETGQKARTFFVKTYEEEFLGYLVPLDGAKEVLRLLKHHHIPMAIVSNKESFFLKPEVMHLGFDSYFQSIVGRDIAGAKPSPDPAYHALRELSLDTSSLNIERVWFVGDTKVDAETAHAVGCTFIGFGDFFEHTQDAPFSHPIKSVANWSQFHSLLSGIHLKYV